MAPLAATIAASAVVAVALLVQRGLAPAESAERRRRDRRLGLQGSETLTHEIKRTIVAQAQLAHEMLDGPLAPDEEEVHEARKAIKRLRATLHLVESELGRGVVKREERVLKELAGSLSEARDAAVLAAALEGLVREHPRLRRHRGVRRLQRRLEAERSSAGASALPDPAARAAALRALQELADRAASWALPERSGIGLVEVGLHELYGSGRRRQRRLAKGHGGVRARHRWRKDVKDLRYSIELLQRSELVLASPAAGEGPHAAARLRDHSRRADELAEMLGEEHDLALLAELVDRAARGSKRRRLLPRKSARVLRAAIRRRRRKLRRRALRSGRRLYGRKPAAFIAAVASDFAACEPVS